MGASGGQSSSVIKAALIDVAPLEIVDGQDQRRPVAQPSQQLAQGREGATSAASWGSGLSKTRRGGLGPCFDLPQAGENPRPSEAMSRGRAAATSPASCRCLRCRPSASISAIEGLVARDRLSLVAAAGQDHSLRPALDPLVQEASASNAVLPPPPEGPLEVETTGCDLRTSRSGASSRAWRWRWRPTQDGP